LRRPEAIAYHSSAAPVTDEPIDGVRLDVWLDVCCLFKTRSAAQTACRGGKVEVNDQAAKPHRLLHPGDEIEIGRPEGRTQLIVVRGLAEKHVSKAKARALYEDKTPPLSPQEIDRRRIERLLKARVPPPKSPDKRARRALRRLKGR
jgi:ribosome-associated heat shock protein Hsp15